MNIGDNKGKGVPPSKVKGLKPSNVPGDKKAIPREVQEAARKMQPLTHTDIFKDGRLDTEQVVNHWAADIDQDINPNTKIIPVTHKQAKISKGNPFARIPIEDLELGKSYSITVPCLGKIDIWKKEFLGVPLVTVRNILTKALVEKKFPEIFYQFLALCFGVPGGISQEKYTAIALTQLALLYEYMDEIFKMCRDPKFSPDEVANFILMKTGILLDIGPNPEETIRLIKNIIKVGEKLINDIPENPDKAQDEKDILDAFETMGIFPQGNVKFADHFQKMREEAIDKAVSKYEEENPNPISLSNYKVDEQGKMIRIYDKKQIGVNSSLDDLKEDFVIYIKNAPTPPEDYYSSNKYREHLLSRNVDEKVRNDFIKDAIDKGVLDLYIPECDDEVDDIKKVIKAEFDAYAFNIYKFDEPETDTLKSFREYFLDEHPSLDTFKVDMELQAMIQNGEIHPYKPKYDEKTNINTILREEALAYRLNQSKNLPDPKDEMAALEKYLRKDRKILTIEGIAPPSEEPQAITKDQLKSFLDKYFEDYPSPQK